MVETVRTGLQALGAYGVVGVLFAAAFHRRGIAALDAGSHGAGLGFRLLITPGVVALWPWLAFLWWRASRGALFLRRQAPATSPRRLRTAHALAWRALAVSMPLIVGAILESRPIDPSRGTPPEWLLKVTQQSGASDSASPFPSPPPGTPRPH